MTFKDSDLKWLKKLNAGSWGTFIDEFDEDKVNALLARLEAAEKVNELRKKLDTFQMDTPEWNQALSELEEAEGVWRKAAGKNP